MRKELRALNILIPSSSSSPAVSGSRCPIIAHDVEVSQPRLAAYLRPRGLDLGPGPGG